LFSAIGGIAADGVIDELIVNGTASDDAIAVVDDGSAVVVQGLAVTVRIARADPTLDRLTVNGLEGNDAITATPGASALILLSCHRRSATTGARIEPSPAAIQFGCMFSQPGRTVGQLPNMQTMRFRTSLGKIPFL
jgi:hypothetical protein